MTEAEDVFTEPAPDDPVRRLKEYRLIFIGPAVGETSVADYSENFIEAVNPYFADVVTHRTPGPGNATLADVRRHRRVVKDLVAEAPPGRVLVHAELSTAAMAPFYAIAGINKDVPVTATVHDPPQGLWYFANTKFVHQHRLLRGGIHVPLLPLSRAIEGAVYRDRHLFALTEAGQRSIQRTFPKAHAHYVPCMSFDRPDIKPAQDRPKAVGFFGYAYRGKGWEQVARIRELLPDDIQIRIAGRGTQTLPGGDGIEILGPVDGPDQDAFFESIRVMVVPYGRRHWAAQTFPACATAASAQSYGTPVISTGYGPLEELTEATGAITVHPSDDEDGVAKAVSEGILSLIDDRERLTELGLNAERTGHERSRAGTGRAFTRVWAQMLQLEPVAV
jgi:glycosyltransferase involved in cell wall biosynthesis